MTKCEDRKDKEAERRRKKTEKETQIQRNSECKGDKGEIKYMAQDTKFKRRRRRQRRRGFRELKYANTQTIYIL
jgi:hypothetical protein